MKSPILALAGSDTGPINSADRFTGPAAGQAPASNWLSNEAQAQVPCPIAGTFSKLRVRYPVVVDAGDTNTVTLRKNGVDTALTCQVGSASILASDTSNTVSFAAGDLISFENTPSGSPNAQANVQIGCMFEATVAGKSVMFAHHNAGPTATTFYIPLGASVGDNFKTTEGDAQVEMPCDGTLDIMYGFLSAAPATTSTRTYTLRKNGADTGLTFTFGSGDTTKNVTASVSVVAGDLLCISCTTNGTAPASAGCGISIGWTPAVSGESAMFTLGGALSTGQTRYLNARGAGTTGNATESTTYNIVPDSFTIKNMRARVATAPSSGKSWTFTLRKNAGDTSLVCAIADANTNDQDTNEVSVAADDLLDYSSVPSGTPTATASARISAVAYVAPATATRRRLTLLGVA